MCMYPVGLGAKRVRTDMSGFQSRNRRLKHLQNVAPHQSNLMRLKQRQEFLDRACSEQRFLRIPVHSGIVTGRVPSSNAKSRTGPPDSIISARLLRVGREKLQRQPPRVYLPQSFLPVTTQHFSSARFSVKKSSKSCRHRETSGHYDTDVLLPKCLSGVLRMSAGSRAQVDLFRSDP